MKLLLVFGTRPEAIKMCPLINELKSHLEYEVVTVFTGQHKEMVKNILEVFNIIPDYNLDIMRSGQTLFDVTGRVLNGMKKIYEEEKPDIVFVHGDTSTAFASALAAYYLGIRVAHVEAGLRTYNNLEPFPEEFNRQAIGSIAKYHFAPTKKAVEHLLDEHKDKEDIFLVGNTVIDALKTTIRDDYDHPVIEWAAGSRLVLLTAHRRENLGKPLHDIFSGILKVLKEHEDVKVVYPIHLNPAVREVARDVFGDFDRIKLIEPLDVLDFHNIMGRSYLILTDSGGIQEEAPALGKPVLVLRNTTERPEGVEAGTLRLVGTDSENVYKEFSLLLDDESEYDKMKKAVNPYGDGTTSKQIADIIKKCGTL